MQSALYEGIVSHRRQRPVPHDFSYSVFMVYLNLNELDHFFALSQLWSLQRFNWASFFRRDYLNPAVEDLRAAVQQEIHRQTGCHFDGEICLLTHVRYLGYCFNPVSFYYCFDQGALAYIVADINNTPWNQRFCYVLCCKPDAASHHFQFAKAFHVSPFLPMDMEYQWRFNTPGDQLSVFMRNQQQGNEVFNACLTLKRQEASASTLNRMLLRFPAVTVKTVAGIYWQALRLWIKGNRFHPHPKSDEAAPHGIHHHQQNSPPEQH